MAVKRGADWLMNTQPQTTQDRTYQLLGLGWAGVKRNDPVIRRAARELLSQQQSDGGWAQLSGLASDAYATGQVLVALQQAAGLATTDPAYRRGIEFLLETQREDGSWYVKTRAIPLQPFFESGFPYGPDQWISAAATNWGNGAGSGRRERETLINPREISPRDTAPGRPPDSPLTTSSACL
jgi:hypothetical protein